ncbi:MAG TPA: hypothetical protein DCZ95_14910 [Verrucomicrobia bacterium]|nr:MAG: hypothetical protein A2X46_17985 [Lentisphaerae bacterium GWF2_57_35]HBA85375.1 hypothetical protein [Verrucomicrobiota bacterium]
MGLDGVELVMALEEAFGVELKDDEVVHTTTPRMVGDVIFSKLQSTDRKVCQSQRSFYLLRKAVMRRFGLQRSFVTPDMPFRNLIPRSKEKELWADLKQSVAARSWPTLVRPPWLPRTIAACALAVFSVTFLVLWNVVPIGAANAAMIGASLMIGVCIFAEKKTQRFKTRIPSNYQRLRDLIPFAVTSDQVRWTRDQVSALVKQVVLEQLEIPEAKYQEDAHFVNDFGLD